MNLIVETDIGHDPDDFFALCYLIEAGINIRCITVVPGDPDQLAIVNFLCKELNLDIPIGVSKIERTKNSSGGMHHDLLNKYKHSLTGKHDGLGHNVIKETYEKYPDSELFIIGPPTNVGNFLRENPIQINRATMQGGFLSNDLHNFDCIRLEQFEGKIWVPTFNLNGDRKGGTSFLAANIKERRLVGKNVCHTVWYDKTTFQNSTFKGRASELFNEAMRIYLQHHDGKKFHDPTAAVCHLHPNVANWVKGKTVKMEGGWGTQLDDNGDYIAASVNYDKLWKHIAEFN